MGGVEPLPIYRPTCTICRVALDSNTEIRRSRRTPFVPDPLMTRLSLFVSVFCFISSTLVAQEIPPANVAPPMMRMNPTALVRMRAQLAAEYQQTLKTLQHIDPSDTKLIEMLKSQQADILAQMKQINDQMKTQGIPVPENEPETRRQPADIPDAKVPTNFAPSASVFHADDVLVQRRESDTTTRPALPTPVERTGTLPNQPNDLPPGMDPRVIAALKAEQERMEAAGVPRTTYYPSAKTDQNQTWENTNSPWAPRTAKEITELKQSVDSLQKEIKSMQETIKGLEAQIQLLNRNIILSLPKVSE